MQVQALFDRYKAVNSFSSLKELCKDSKNDASYKKPAAASSYFGTPAVSTKIKCQFNDKLCLVAVIKGVEYKEIISRGRKTLYLLEVELAESYSNVADRSSSSRNSSNSSNSSKSRPASFKLSYQSWGEVARDRNRFIFLEGRIVVLINFECSIVVKSTQSPQGDDPRDPWDLLITDGPAGTSLLVINDERSLETLSSISNSNSRIDDFNNDSTSSRDDYIIYFWDIWNGDIPMQRQQFHTPETHDKISSLVLENRELKKSFAFPFPLDSDSWRISRFQTGIVSSPSPIRYSVDVAIVTDKAKVNRPESFIVADSSSCEADLVFSNKAIYEKFNKLFCSFKSKKVQVYLSGLLIHHVSNFQAKTLLVDLSTTFDFTEISHAPTVNSTTYSSSSSSSSSSLSAMGAVLPSKSSEMMDSKPQSIQQIGKPRIVRAFDPISCTFSEFWENIYFAIVNKEVFRNQLFLLTVQVSSIAIENSTMQLSLTGDSPVMSGTSQPPCFASGKKQLVTIEDLIQVSRPNSSSSNYFLHDGIELGNFEDDKLSVCYRSSTLYIQQALREDRDGGERGMGEWNKRSRVDTSTSSQHPMSMTMSQNPRLSQYIADVTNSKSYTQSQNNQSGFGGSIPVFITSDAWTKVFSNIPACFVCNDLVELATAATSSKDTVAYLPGSAQQRQTENGGSSGGKYVNFCRQVLGILNGRNDGTSSDSLTLLVSFKALYDEHGQELSYELFLDDIVS